MIQINSEILKQAQIWRQDFHAHPELAFEENRTADFIASELKSMGLEVHRGLAKTGVVAVLDKGAGPVIGLRADMDALPIKEETGVNYCSTQKGVMHACGHDGHTAMLLAAAKEIVTIKGLKGKVVFIFQPAEENFGGAETMIKDGLFEKFPMDAIYGLHNMPNLPIGTFMAKAGTVSAAYDAFDIEVIGKGGHGAMPELSTDPLLAASALVMGLNTIVSRNIAPSKAAVVSVCHINAGEAHNVIPDTANLRGSCRSFDVETRAILQKRMEEICAGLETAYGVKVKLKYEHGYPSVVNTEAETEALIRAAKMIAKPEAVITEFDAFMGSEDFSYFLQKRPGCYFILGSGETGGPLHSPHYNFNDAALPYGIAIWVQLVKNTLV